MDTVRPAERSMVTVLGNVGVERQLVNKFVTRGIRISYGQKLPSFVLVLLLKMDLITISTLV